MESCVRAEVLVWSCVLAGISPKNTVVTNTAIVTSVFCIFTYWRFRFASLSAFHKLIHYGLTAPMNFRSLETPDSWMGGREMHLASNQHDALFCVFIYFTSLHVSSITVLIIRRSNCINTSFGMINLCKWLLGVSDRHTKQSLTQVAAATPPNQPQRCILTDYFKNCNLVSSNNTLPDDGDWTKTCRSCFNVNFNILLRQPYCLSVGE
jgi:hypothetical protein